jgi:hypothetical protein
MDLNLNQKEDRSFGLNLNQKEDQSNGSEFKSKGGSLKCRVDQMDLD